MKVSTSVFVWKSNCFSNFANMYPHVIIVEKYLAKISYLFSEKSDFSEFSTQIVRSLG